VAHHPSKEAADRVGLPSGRLHDGGDGRALAAMEHLDHPGLLRSPPAGLGRLSRSHVPGLLARSLAPSPSKPRSGEKAGGAFVCELPMGRAEVLSISGSVNVLGSPDGLGHQTSQQGGCTSVRPRETCPNGPMGIRTCGVDVIPRPLAPGTSSRYGSPLKIISLWQIEHVTARERTNAPRTMQNLAKKIAHTKSCARVEVEHGHRRNLCEAYQRLYPSH
jgi:hypothetical protein